jgi:hypothetical protein
MKHIEQILPEYAAFELDRIGREETDATASAALTALLHNVTGCAIPPTADTPESEVEELVPLCLSILRRHWTTPLTALGDGTTPMSLADLLRRLILGRVDGNESLGIPPANANIPTAVSALTKRHIDDGLTLTLTDGTDGSTPTTTSLPDGISLAQVLCSDIAITEMHDTNKGWTMSKAFANGLFPSCNKITINADRIVLGNQGNPTNLLSTVSSIKEVNLNATYAHCSFNIPADGELNAPNLTEFYVNNGTGPNCEIVYIPKLRIATGKNIYRWWQTGVGGIKCKKIVVGSIISGGLVSWTNGTAEDLIHLEFGADGLGGLQVSQNLSWWTATNVLSERLPEFLQNFRSHIAERLTDHGSGLTLTLSQAVRDAIQTDPEIVSIITSKGWTISPAPSV